MVSTLDFGYFHIVQVKFLDMLPNPSKITCVMYDHVCYPNYLLNHSNLEFFLEYCEQNTKTIEMNFE